MSRSVLDGVIIPLPHTPWFCKEEYFYITKCLNAQAQGIVLLAFMIGPSFCAFSIQLMSLQLFFQTSIFSISIYGFQVIPFSEVSIRKFCAQIFHLIVLCVPTCFYCIELLRLLCIFIYASQIPLYVYKLNLTVKSTTIVIIGFVMHILFCLRTLSITQNI